jgi:hypothetical protein
LGRCDAGINASVELGSTTKLTKRDKGDDASATRMTASKSFEAL